MTRYRRFSPQGNEVRVDHPIDGAAHTPISRAAAPTEPRLALLIGNSRYRWQDSIDNPVRDVRLIAWALEGLGFTVSRIENAALAQMQDAVFAFGEALEAAGPEAVAVFYFAGHGIQQNGVNFLVPVDAQLTSPRHLAARALALDAVVAELARGTRRATLIVLDACRNALPGLDTEAASPTEGLARARLPRPAQLVYSTAAEAMASDGAHENSPFAHALADELPSLLTPGRKIQDAIDDVAAKVSLATEGAQTVAVYREGVLLPLALTALDEARLRDWSKRRPYRLGRRQILLRTLAATVALAATTAATIWLGAYPETRTTWLLRAGLLDRASYDFACEPPWDSPADRYGLTRRDWCLAMQDQILTDKVTKAGKWESDVNSGLHEGDPKALYLAAIQKGQQSRSLTGPDRTAALAQAQALATRAALTELPRGAIAPYMVDNDPLSSKRSMTDVRRDIGAARDAGVLFAAVLLPILENDWRNFGLNLPAGSAMDAIDAALQRAAELDQTGAMAESAADIFSGRNRSLTNIASPERERYWLRRAAFAGRPAAAAELLDRSRIDAAFFLTEVEQKQLSATVMAGDDPAALFWRSRARARAGGPRNDAEMIALLTRSAEGGFPPAISDLVDDYLSDGGPGRPDIAQAMFWLDRGRSLGDSRSISRLGALLARGRVSRDGQVLLAERPDEARALLERQEVAADPRAMIALARLLRYGPPAIRDPTRAETLFKQLEARLPFPDIALAAREETRRIQIERALALGAEPLAAITVGNPQAPLTISIAFVPSCRDCRIAERLRLLEPFVMANSARISLLPIWSEDSLVDADAALTAACAAPEARIPVALRLIERQAAWGSLVDDDARRLALTNAVAGVDVSREQMAACFANQELAAAVRRQRNFVVRSLDISSAPAVLVGGQLLRSDSADELLAAVKAQLPLDADRAKSTPP